MTDKELFYRIKENAMDIKNMNVIATLTEEGGYEWMELLNNHNEFNVGAISWTTKKVRVDMKSVGKSGYSPYLIPFKHVTLHEEE